MHTPPQPFGSLTELDEHLVMVAEDMVVHIAQMVIFALDHGAETFELSPVVIYVQGEMVIRLNVSAAISALDTVTIDVSFNHDDVGDTNALSHEAQAELLDRFLNIIQKDTGLESSLDHSRTTAQITERSLEISICLVPQSS